MYIHTYVGLSGPLWASLGLSGFCMYIRTYVCIHTYVHMYIKITRQEPTAGASVFLGARSWQTTRPHNTYIPDSWSPSVLRGQNLQDKKTRQCPTAGAPVFLEARNCQTTKADNTYPTAGTPVSFECHFLIKLSSFRSHPRTVRTMNQISQISHVSRIGGNGRSRHLALALIVHASLPTF